MLRELGLRWTDLLIDFYKVWMHLLIFTKVYAGNNVRFNIVYFYIHYNIQFCWN